MWRVSRDRSNATCVTRQQEATCSEPCRGGLSRLSIAETQAEANNSLGRFPLSRGQMATDHEIPSCRALCVSDPHAGSSGQECLDEAEMSRSSPWPSAAPSRTELRQSAVKQVERGLGGGRPLRTTRARTSRRRRSLHPPACAAGSAARRSVPPGPVGCAPPSCRRSPLDALAP
jgi:hypothetical protein